MLESPHGRTGVIPVTEALLFDFDGLILDTESPDFQVWKEVYADYGHELTVGLWAQNVGGSWLSRYNPYDHLEELLGCSIDRNAVKAGYKARAREIILEQPILPGVQDYIKEAKEMGIKVGVASSSDHAWVDGNLERLGLLHEFEVVVCAEDVENIKPHPELFLTAAARLNASPARTIVLEDSPNGARAAHDAGTFCVVVPNPLTAQLPFDHGHLHLNALSDVPLAQVIALAAER